ncbi:hypothetical protein N7461_008600 [Penicillium sp. DV-2018c]|nr:hypothetical protein N7461_008600 [Penicillium sp. DV-2018c]
MSTETSYPGAMFTKSMLTISRNSSSRKLTRSSSESRNPRRPPEESGPFGKRRNARYDTARSRTRTGTPAKRENPNVAEFGRLFSQQQQEDEKTGLPKSSSSSSLDNARKQTEKVATECILYGYKNKDSEWKVIDKYERVSQGTICEDYPRTDPTSATHYPQLLSGGDVVIRNLSADANRKSKRYAGGDHWIKITYDSTQSADRACFYSPQEIDGHLVYCELYHGQGPAEDVPIPANAANNRIRNRAPRTLTTSHSTAFISGSSKDQDRMTLPRSFAMNNLSSIPDALNEDYSFDSSTAAATSEESMTSTATSATATAPPPSFQHGTTSSSSTWTTGASSTDQAPIQRRGTAQRGATQDNEYMTHIPTVRRTKLRPLVEALPPQPTLTERILRSIPILSWFTGDIVGEGPILRDDGTLDLEKSGLYWRFWYAFDYYLKTDMCGLKEDS